MYDWKNCKIKFNVNFFLCITLTKSFYFIGWAHVVCALYIPEVRFGDVSTMEPIIFSSVPAERFNKVTKHSFYVKQILKRGRIKNILWFVV